MNILMKMKIFILVKMTYLNLVILKIKLLYGLLILLVLMARYMVILCLIKGLKI